MYFHTDSTGDLNWLAKVTERAAANNLPLRIKVTEEGELMVKLGGGMWTPPMVGTHDINRDETPNNVIPLGRK